METIKSLLAMCGMFFMFFGACLADSTSLMPTIVCMAIGLVMIFIVTKLEERT